LATLIGVCREQCTTSIYSGALSSASSYVLNRQQPAGDGAAPADFSDHLRSVDGSQKYTVRYLTICLPGLFQRVAKCKLVGYI
ncbi:hypothetical protein, partial [Pseudomonas syringae]|uniref:hypothetical protein n=1 Tax=Pseudomonas syringae TaxID=317 RepID=UPI001F1F6DEA